MRCSASPAPPTRRRSSLPSGGSRESTIRTSIPTTRRQPRDSRRSTKPTRSPAIRKSGARMTSTGPIGRDQTQGREPAGPTAPPPGRVPGSNIKRSAPKDLEDLFGSESPFSDFFHDLYGRSDPRGGSGFDRGPLPGRDVEAERSITLEEAYRGTVRTLELETPQGRRRVEVRIPPGVRDGTRARVAGQGTPGRNGGQAGDILVRVHVLPHPLFRREGDDLYVRVPVPLDVALLGGEVPVPTLRGSDVSLRVSPETQNGARLRLRGLGMPRVRGEGNGDLLRRWTFACRCRSRASCASWPRDFAR
jgi:curved DNA-binding protein CbpA